MCGAYLFAILALIGPPAALRPGIEEIVAWIAQTFLQPVRLSSIIVGADGQSAAADRRAQDTCTDAGAVLDEVTQIQARLAVQDQGQDQLPKTQGGPAVAGPA